ncbi:MAG: trypsin-like peptidase domain-containing protein [Lachnospiraceae bacterium]|nr:trypsin-like peptidase domain-containing protein [Lachnospiraceae bacterium]
MYEDTSRYFGYDTYDMGNQNAKSEVAKNQYTNNTINNTTNNDRFAGGNQAVNSKSAAAYTTTGNDVRGNVPNSDSGSAYNASMNGAGGHITGNNAGGNVTGSNAGNNANGSGAAGNPVGSNAAGNPVGNSASNKAYATGAASASTYGAGSSFTGNNATNKDLPTGASPTTKKSGGGFKKILLSVSLGLFFGMFAGIGFYAVQLGVDRMERQDSTEVTAEVVETATSDEQEGVKLNTNTVTVVQSNISDVVEEVMPAMVSIVNNYTYTSSFWGHTYSQQEAASGSGIIVAENDTEFLIVSNNHVVEDAEKLELTFIDGAVAEAKIKGLDADMDLAVIAVAKDSLSEQTKNAITVAKLGDSDELKLGEPVIAIGNALGYGQSVTDGIVSALNREITLDDGSTGIFIQTDAAINPGNSGGALLNVNGEVIGINSNKIGGDAIEGMGYAIPITSANPIIADLMERQTRNEVAEENKGYMGISPQEVTAQISGMYNMPQGIYVVSVEPGSAADNAGIVAGDIITKFDGEEVTSYVELQNILQYFAAGDSVKVTVMRPENGQYMQHDIMVTLDKRP